MTDSRGWPLVRALCRCGVTFGWEVTMRPIGLAVILTLSLTLAPIAEPPAAGKVYRIGYLGPISAFTTAGQLEASWSFPKVQLLSESIVLAVGARLDRESRPRLGFTGISLLAARVGG